MPLRVLALLCVAAIVGCSADNVDSPLVFFPGSEKTGWDDCGKFGGGGNEVQVCAALLNAPGTSIPVDYSISFFLPSPADVRIVVFDAHGALIKVLLDDSEPATAGPFRTPPVDWDLTDQQGEHVPHGDYRVYMRAGQFLSSSDIAL
ncbi:MAG TPA: hypothetical protein VEU09_01690 [Candidatus Binatia bacterium]|nr:hypothetical protein [Candidatus Binatia bacterium]